MVSGRTHARKVSRKDKYTKAWANTRRNYEKPKQIDATRTIIGPALQKATTSENQFGIQTPLVFQTLSTIKRARIDSTSTPRSCGNSLIATGTSADSSRSSSATLFCLRIACRCKRAAREH